MSSNGRTQSVPLRDVSAITNCVYDWVSPEANAASAESAFLNDSTPTQRGGGGVGSSTLPPARPPPGGWRRRGPEHPAARLPHPRDKRQRNQQYRERRRTSQAPRYDGFKRRR